MKSATSFLALLLLVTLACESGFDDGVVAVVGNQAVLADEMKSRFAVTPYFSQFPEHDQQTKLLVLASLMGEKLLALEARRAGLDQSGQARLVAQEFEKEAVLEKLLNDLFSELVITPEQIQQGLQRSQRVLDVEEMVFTTRAEAEQVMQGLPSTAKSLTSSEVKPGEVSTYTVKWGDVDPLVEDVLWNLKSGSVSSPVAYQGHFYLFRIAKQVVSPVSQGDLPTILPRIRSMLEKTARRQVYSAYFNEVMAGKQTRVPPEKLTYIAEQIEQALDIPPSEQADSTALAPALMPPEYYTKSRERLHDRLEESFIVFDDGSDWSIGDFLSNLRYGPYPLNYSSRAHFRASLHNMAIMMMEQEYMARDGYARGLDRSPEVRTERQVWQASYLADQMRLKVLRADDTDDASQKSNMAEVSPSSSGKLAQVRREALDAFLAAAMASHSVRVNHTLLDTLELRHLKMMVYKRHFPGRQAAPLILPLDRLPKYFAAAMARLRK